MLCFEILPFLSVVFMFTTIVKILLSESPMVFFRYLYTTILLLDALFFKLIALMWMILCAISRSTYFAVSYSGSLDCMLRGVKLGEENAKYCRKAALIYASVAWVLAAMSFLFTMYSLFFTGRSLDITLAPITTHVNVSHMLTFRLGYLLFSIYLHSAWIFPQTMSFMLARIFTHQYRQIGQNLEQTLKKSDERRVSDSDIETFREQHQDISMHLDEADDFLMFHNAGAFCCQLIKVILLLYILIFFPCTEDPVVLTMHIFWLLGTTFGLTVTTAGGIMVNHYVSMHVNLFMCLLKMYMIFSLTEEKCFRMQLFGIFQTNDTCA